MSRIPVVSIVLSLVIATALSGCLSVAKPKDPKLRAAQSRAIVAQVLAVGQDGDWLVVRGYKKVDDLVATVTQAQLSHVAVLDRSRELVIEAEGKGIHRTPLRTFVDKCHRVMVIRPQWATAGGDAKALARAHAAVGKKYDFLGTVGLNQPDRYYCSELAVQIYKDRFDRKTRMPPVIEPGKLYYWGRIIYDSGNRARKAQLERTTNSRTPTTVR